MEREQLIKEIQQAAERIKNNSGNDNQLINEATLLYEKVILLKYLPVTEFSSAKVASPLIQKEEIKSKEKVNTAADLFSDTSETQKEQVKKTEAAKTADTSNSKSSGKKVTDLKSIIGINDKFQFINELFDGNMKEYTVALDQINNFSSKQEADNYLNNLRDMYKWQKDNLVVSNFQDVVNKLFV